MMQHTHNPPLSILYGQPYVYPAFSPFGIMCDTCGCDLIFTKIKKDLIGDPERLQIVHKVFFRFFLC